jgi:hypothetical protein
VGLGVWLTTDLGGSELTAYESYFILLNIRFITGHKRKGATKVSKICS